MFNKKAKEIKRPTARLEYVEKTISDYLAIAHPHSYHNPFFSPSCRLERVIAKLLGEQEEKREKEILRKRLTELGVIAHILEAGETDGCKFHTSEG